MASVKEIAEHLQMSSATVSRVLNSRPGIAPATRQRVLDAANELGFGRSVGLRTSRYIGFVHPLGQFAGNLGEYHAALIGGMGLGLGQQQFDLALIDPYRDKRHDETYSQFFMRKDLQGVILQVRPQNLPVARAIADEGFPMLLIASALDHPKANYLVVDSATGYEQAVDHLYHLGHRRIAMVERDAMDYDHSQRVEGFERACRRLGLPLEPALRFKCPSDTRAGASVIRRITTMPERPTAVVFVNSGPTRGALRACIDLGLSVPGDLSIVGFDDGKNCYESVPSYTAVCQDAEALGTEAASLIGGLLAGAIQSPLGKTLPTIFEVNESTGPPRAGGRLASNPAQHASGQPDPGVRR